MKHRLFNAGLTLLHRSSASRLLKPWTRGLGAILMFHHVRPFVQQRFNPFQGLEITPDFLDALLHHIKAQGYHVIPIAELETQLTNPRPERPFVVLTFDDGYRDNATYALPILKAHQAPFTVFATTGFADGKAPLWWLDLAAAVDQGRPLHVAGKTILPLTDSDRKRAFREIFSAMMALRGEEQAAFAERIAREAGVESTKTTEELCMDWKALRRLADDPLCTIGAHTISHPLLKPQTMEVARNEMALSREKLSKRLDKSIDHFAYPVGDRDAAGQREFVLAFEIGFKTAVTTRPGVLFPEHARHLHALPRLSVNGMHQSLAHFDVLLSGAAFSLLNKGRRLNVD